MKMENGLFMTLMPELILKEILEFLNIKRLLFLIKPELEEPT